MSRIIIAMLSMTGRGTNAANLSLFMVDVSQVLMCEYRKNDPDFSILDLKVHY